MKLPFKITSTAHYDSMVRSMKALAEELVVSQHENKQLKSELEKLKEDYKALLVKAKPKPRTRKRQNSDKLT